MKLKRGIIIAIILIAIIIAFVLYKKEILQFGEDNEKSNYIPGQASIGYIGCSNTRETVEGYHRVGGGDMWDYDKRYDSGAVKDWALDAEPEKRYWNVFDELLEENPKTKFIWWELCIRDDERETNYEQAQIILNEIRQRIPDAVIYVSALADYTEGVCEITGTFGIEKAKELVRELENNNADVFPGPVLGPMAPIDTAKDGCHLSSPDGKRKLGNQMKKFFDNEMKTDDNELSFEEKVWQQRIDAAVAPVNCPAATRRTYPQGYYAEKLIDTHFHIANIPDSTPREFEKGYQEESEHPRLGKDISIADIVCTLEHEGTAKALGFFPLYREIQEQMAQVVYETMQKYPDKFIPFIMPPDNDGSPDGFPTVEAQTLQEMLNIYPGLFEGYGEIGLYARGDNGGPTGAPELPPDSQRLADIYPIIRENNLVIYFHLGEGQKESFETALTANPDINFIWHGDQLIPYENGIQNLEHIDDILSNHPNAYYGIDELYGDIWLLRPEVSKEEFLAHFENQEELLEKDLATWKNFIDSHPNQVLWGTDRGWSSKWSIDKDVGITLSDYTRAFIGRLSPDVQEKFAYKNAERLFGE